MTGYLIHVAISEPRLFIAVSASTRNPDREHRPGKTLWLPMQLRIAGPIIKTLISQSLERAVCGVDK
ncbi:hypothetical protein [Methyloferula stellata]|uniref:hypothetical protein n=1 Tax=Methyloferula stellata TaxID=876270 RepID=UPI000365DD3C|nr:hypothetical protein [Methyloferula stellata]